MNKYTIKKTFEKKFPFNIWKIEVDSLKNLLAIECRNPDNTLPIFYVLSFNGEILLNEFVCESREWTIESIQDDYLILKRFGEYSPIQSGIQVIHIPSSKIIYTYMEYVLKDVFDQTILAYHRSVPNGLPFYIQITSGEVKNSNQSTLKYRQRDINSPVVYSRKIPKFMENVDYYEQLWIQPYANNFLWAYHSKTNNQYQLNLALTSKNEVIDTKVVLNNLDKLIPQPFFTVKDYIFFLSSNKMKISSYLV